MTKSDREIRDEVFAFVDKQATILFFVLSKRGKIIEANRFAQRCTGRPLVGEDFAQVIVDFPGAMQLDDLLIQCDREHLLNLSMAGGLPQSFFFSFKPIEDRILVLGRMDVAELEDMRRDILTMNQDLNNLTRQLHKQNAELEQLNRLKNQFLGMAAHDLRKPIGLVLSYAEFVIDEASDTLNGEHLGFLNTILESCSFMKRLVDNFLDVSAIEAGRFDMDLEPARFDDVLEQSLELNRIQASKKGVDLQVRSETTLPRMLMDPAKIEQVIVNLVSNAIEHTQPDTTVGIVSHFDGDSIGFSVQDRGPGIAPEDMDKLFKPFGKTRTQKTGGEKSTGLGLVITRKIIEAHGGTIDVTSEVGKGTTVSFKLPLRQGAA